MLLPTGVCIESERALTRSGDEQEKTAPIGKLEWLFGL